MSAVKTDGDNRPRGKSLNHTTHVGASSGGLATKGKFAPSDPKNTEVGWGVVHLYREGQETPGLYDDIASGAGSDGKAFNEEDCTTLCILAVPSYMTPSDLLGYVGEQTREDVTHFRLIRTGRANKYMVLMKFRDAQKAREWRREWNGKLFNSMEVHYGSISKLTYNSHTNYIYSPRTAMSCLSSLSNSRPRTRTAIRRVFRT
jgi:BRCA1-associated protein